MEIQSGPSTLEEFEYDRDRGITSIPCVPNSKAAAVKWGHLRDREPTRSELSQWVEMFRAGYNRAILCGARSGVVGIDLDDVPRGMAVLRERGIPLSPARTRTWSRKLHLIYAWGAPVRPAVRVLGEPIDVRGDGSYLIAAGSRIDGNCYERIGAWERSRLPLYDPTWFEVTMPSDRRPPPTPLVSTRLESVRRYIAKIVAVSGQGGHNATYRAACKAADAGLGFDEILGLLTVWNETNAVPKWDAGSLIHKTRSALNRTQRR